MVLTVRAYVNHGRWVAECPLEDGYYAVAAKPGRGFTCACHGREYVIAFPPEFAEIEAVLGRRPALRNRNWTPDETVADLERENAAHGIGGA